jgi:hypothetical protein
MVAADLPLLPTNRLPANVLIAYNQIARSYVCGQALLSQEQPDTIRLKVLADTLRNQCLAVIMNISKVPTVDTAWANQVHELFVELECSLRSSVDAIQGNDHNG